MKEVFIMILALFLFSCNRDQTCYSCTTTFTVTIKDSGGIDSFSISDTRSKCDVNENEIREFEKNNSDSVTYINGELRIDTVTVTVCKR
jgi:predicted peptidase